MILPPTPVMTPMYIGAINRDRLPYGVHANADKHKNHGVRHVQRWVVSCCKHCTIPYAGERTDRWDLHPKTAAVIRALHVGDLILVATGNAAKIKQSGFRPLRLLRAKKRPPGKYCADYIQSIDEHYPNPHFDKFCRANLPRKRITELLVLMWVSFKQSVP